MQALDQTAPAVYSGPDDLTRRLARLSWWDGARFEARYWSDPRQAPDFAIFLLGLRKPVGILFDDIVPLCGDRAGGFTRIVKLGRRHADNSEMAILEWVDTPAPAVTKSTASGSKKKAAPAEK